MAFFHAATLPGSVNFLPFLFGLGFSAMRTLRPSMTLNFSSSCPQFRGDPFFFASTVADGQSGEVRILGIMDDEHSPFYPGVKTFEEQGIQDELDAYNPLIPDGSNLKATMMIEFEDAAERAADNAPDHAGE